MAFALGTDIVLDAIRTALGSTLTVGGQTLTWVHKLEGDPLRWRGVLESVADYPCYIMRPGMTAATTGAALKELRLPVTIHVLLLHESAAAKALSPKVYRAVRLVGEAMVGKLEDAGLNLDSSYIAARDLVECGVDYDLTEALADHGLAVYAATYEFRYYEREVP